MGVLTIFKDLSSYLFFFQAEDGIRDHCVTGVQTCALPISLVGIVANVLAAPFGEVIALPLCLSHALTSFWPAQIGRASCRERV